MTTVYLIRHSVRLKKDRIASYRTSQHRLVSEEKIVLSPLGEKRAEILCGKEEFDNVEVIYASNCVRTLQTGKYLMDRLGLDVHIDDRLDERRIGIIDPTVTDWFERQYLDLDYKTEGGESLREVSERVAEAMDEILETYEGKTVAVFSHGYAITSYMLKFCTLLHASLERLTYGYRDGIVIDGQLNAPDVFKLTFEGKELLNLEHITFDDLPFEVGV